MPTYQYRCKACLFEMEEFQKFSEEPLVACPSCKKEAMVRVIGGSGLVFKGSGFYLTDYKNKSTTDAAAPAPAKPKPDADATSKAPESSPPPKSSDAASPSK